MASLLAVAYATRRNVNNEDPMNVMKLKNVSDSSFSIFFSCFSILFSALIHCCIWCDDCISFLLIKHNHRIYPWIWWNEMSSSVSVLHDYKFTEGSIFELKFNGITEQGSKSHRFQWYLIYNDMRWELSFTSMTPTTRLLHCRLYEVEVDLVNLDLRIKMTTDLIWKIFKLEKIPSQ